MRILFVAPIHHPEALREAHAAARLATVPPPLFPPSVSQHFYEKALIKRGHALAVFYRNQSGFAPQDVLLRGQTKAHRQGITPGKLIEAGLNRVPPRANPDLRIRNQRLIDMARTFKPDVLWMVGDNTVIYPETIAAIKRESGCKALYACGTSPIVFSKPIDRAAARLYDLVITNDFYHGIQWLEMGAHKMVCLPIAAVDPEFHRPYALDESERAKLACDIAFVGTLVPNHLYSERVRDLEALSAAGVDLGIWSVHDIPASLKKHYRGKALGEDMERILSAAKICFNKHGDFMRYGGNLRLFEVAGAGVFQISDDVPGVREWFPVIDGVPSIVTYTDPDDLCRKTAYYLQHADERAAIAANAQRHMIAHHTYDHRAAHLEELLENL